MIKPNRRTGTDSASPDLTYRPPAQTDAAAFRFERVTLTLDQDFRKESWELLPMSANKLVLGTGKDEVGGTGHTYTITFNNGDLALPTPYLIVDGSALQGSNFVADPSFFGDSASIDLTRVTTANAHVITGGGLDAVYSGTGSDWIRTGAGDDYVSIGSGADSVSTGAQSDYIESRDADFTAADRIDGGAGVDEISFFAQDVHDADLAKVRSVELIRLSENGDLELDANAQRAGVRVLFIDDSAHAITVGAGFERAVRINMYGNQENQVTIDASQSGAKLVVHAEYSLATLVRDFHGGTGAKDTLWVSGGFSGLPAYGADLTNVTGFEKIVVDGGGDAGAVVRLDTSSDEISAAFQSVDSRSVPALAPLTLKADQATVALHVFASAGDDHIRTGSGDDRIEGGLGGDTLAAKGGHDVFAYSHVADSAFGGIDLLTDFRSGRDTIDVTGLGADDPALKRQTISFFGNVGDDTGFAATAGDGVLDAVYHTDTQTLWFDTDDSGTLDAGDLHIVLALPSSLQAADVLAGQMVI